MFQAPSGQRVNTDSCTFAALIGENDHPPKRILDIGCGTGVVALMLAIRFPNINIVGVEPEIEIAKIASRNFSHDQWNGKISLIEKTAQELDPITEGTFDFIACNPPYFQNSTLSSSHLRKVARHTTSLLPHEIFTSFAKMLTKEGSAWLSCPFQDKSVWIDEGKKSGLFCLKEIDIYDHPDSKSHVSILQWAPTERPQSVNEKIVYRTKAHGEQSEWMKEFRSIWYPARYFKSN